MRGNNVLELQWPRDTNTSLILLFVVFFLVVGWLFAGLCNKHVFNDVVPLSDRGAIDVLPTQCTSQSLQLEPINGTAPGPTRLLGPVGPAGPSGPPIVMRGDYNTSDTYTFGNLVTYAQRTYLAISNTTSGIAPGTKPSVWLPFSTRHPLVHREPK